MSEALTKVLNAIAQLPISVNNVSTATARVNDVDSRSFKQIFLPD
jgi:hypothetical protein